MSKSVYHRIDDDSLELDNAVDSVEAVLFNEDPKVMNCILVILSYGCSHKKGKKLYLGHLRTKRREINKRR